MLSTEVTLKRFSSHFIEYSFISEVQRYITVLWCSENVLIESSLQLQSISLLCHFSEHAFAAIAMEGRKARLRRTQRLHPIHHAAQSLDQIHLDHL